MRQLMASLLALLLGLFIPSTAALAQNSPAATWRDGSFRTSDGVRIHYLTAGSGRTIVFVPGWTMPAEIWEPQLRHFASSYRVAAIDPRSQGQSDIALEGSFIKRRAKDIEELLEHLGGEPVVLVGWSLGVAEILEMIEQSGTDRVAGVVLVDGLVWTVDRPGIATMFQNILVAIAGDRRAFTTQFVRGMYRTPQDSAYLRRITEASLKTPTPIAYTLIASTYSVGRRDWRPGLARVDRPLLYIGTPATASDAEAIRTAVAGAQIETFDQAGHALFVDDPERFNGVLGSFLRRLP